MKFTTAPPSTVNIVDDDGDQFCSYDYDTTDFCCDYTCALTIDEAIEAFELTLKELKELKERMEG